MLKGIDISNWQGKANINLPEVIRRNRLDFVIVKATEGQYYVDGYCDKFIQEAEASGCDLIGFYHFADPRNDPVKEADYFMKHTAGYFGRYIPVLDLETRAANAAAWAYKFISRVIDKKGVRPWLYSYLSYFNTYDFRSVKSLDVGFWLAEYKSSANITSWPSVTYTQPKYDLPVCAYQFTSKGRLNGYPNNLDLDYFYGDRSAWLKYAAVNTAADPGLEDHQKLIEELAGRVLAGQYGDGERRKKALGLLYDEVQKTVNDLSKEKQK